MSNLKTANQADDFCAHLSRKESAFFSDYKGEYMLLSLSLIFLVGLSMSAICQSIRLPRIIGMIVTGIALGPYVLDMFDPKILSISGELRQIALVIILIKAGLSLNIADLKKVGRPAILMSFVPASFEILAYYLLAPLLLGVSKVDALVMGTVLGAVSPAIVVPRMVKLIDNHYGTSKSIPQLILASASCDDIFVIVLFTSFVGLAQGGVVNVGTFVNIPISIVLGVLSGAVCGLLLSRLFRLTHSTKRSIDDTVKTVIILGVALLLVTLEDMVAIPYSGLLAVVAMACVVKLLSNSNLTAQLGSRFGKIWVPAELLLFVLVGSAVDISYVGSAGIMALLMIMLALLMRSIGVVMCLMCTKLNTRERLFCVLAYLPKATVQASIGAIPLSLGLPCGDIVLTVAVLSILVTAPLGAMAIDSSYSKLLTHDIPSIDNSQII